jgi:putative DNA primase/helicase
MVTIALPDEVTTEDVWEARNLLENELLGDFPFDGQASRANALGAMLVPFLRDSIEGPTPLHLIDKPEAGTGAGLLAACISIPGPGPTSSLRSGHIRKTNMQDDPLRTRGRANSRVVGQRGGADHVANPQLDADPADLLRPQAQHEQCGGVCGALPAPNDGQQRQAVGDTVRRVVPIRLDAGVEYPAERTGPAPGRAWRHPLPSWAEQNRAELVRAVLVLCRWWCRQESRLRRSPASAHTRYEEVVGGVLMAAGVEGFLTNRPRPEDSDENRAAYTALLGKWAEVYGNEWKTAKEAAEDERMHPFLEDLGIAPDDAGELGTLLRDNRGAVRDSRRIERGKRRENRMTWRVANA